MLSNTYFLAKFRFDTAENKPAKNLQNFAKFANFANPNPPVAPNVVLVRGGTACCASCDPRDPSSAIALIGRSVGRANLTGLVLGCIEAKFCK